MNNRAKRLVAVGAFAVAAAALPAMAAVMTTSAPSTSAGPACLAWYGNKDDGICLGYSNGSPVSAGSPQVASGGNGNGGVSTGALLPGTTISRGIN